MRWPIFQGSGVHRGCKEGQGSEGPFTVDIDVLGAMRDTTRAVRTESAVHILQPPDGRAIHVYCGGRRHLPSIHPLIHVHEIDARASGGKT